MTRPILNSRGLCHVHRLEDLIFKRCTFFPKLIYRFDAIPIINSIVSLIELEKLILSSMKALRAKESQGSLEEEQAVWDSST